LAEIKNGQPGVRAVHGEKKFTVRRQPNRICLPSLEIDERGGDNLRRCRQICNSKKADKNQEYAPTHKQNFDYTLFLEILKALRAR
jgi:hypothetical protein